MKKTDVCALWGSWPFRRLSHHTAAELQQMHRRYGITDGFVASLESIFYQDPLEGEEALAEALAGTGYRQIVTVNPALPAVGECIDEAAERFAPAAIRIVPCYQSFRLDDDCMVPLGEALARHRLPLVVVRQIEDFRLNHLVTPREPDTQELLTLSRGLPETRILCSGFRPGNAAELAACTDPEQVFFDSCLFKLGTGDFPDAVRAVGEDRLLFGSAYPFYVMGTQVANIEQNGLGEETREKLFFRNAQRFFGV